MSNPKPLPTDDLARCEGVVELIRELAVKPPVKGMANVKAATEVFEANQPGSGRSSQDTEADRRLADPAPRD